MPPPRRRAPRPRLPTSPFVNPPRSSARTSTTPVFGSRQEIDMGAAVAEALFGAAPRRQIPPRPAATPAPEQGDDMQPTVGSVLHFAPSPPGWLANLADENGKVWQEPVIGWACVVIWAAYASENEDPDTKGTNQFQTEVQPVTLASDGTMEPVVFRDGVTLFSLAMPGMVRL
jgi:hypothetical protein